MAGVQPGEVCVLFLYQAGGGLVKGVTGQFNAPSPTTAGQVLPPFGKTFDLNCLGQQPLLVSAKCRSHADQDILVPRETNHFFVEFCHNIPCKGEESLEGREKIQ